MNKLYRMVAAFVCYANDNSAFIPAIWSQMGLAILEENMVMANLVHRDFENDVKDYGDTVNTRRPGTFGIRRKTDATTLTQQDANATNVQVKLDQWFYTSFVIKDGERTKAFQDLVTVYLLPGMQTIARGVDRAVLGQIHKYLRAPGNRAGRLGAMDGTNSGDFVIEADQHLNENLAYPDSRRLVIGSASNAAMLKNPQFISAEKRGDGGNALENARLGRILGFDTYLAQNVPSSNGSGDKTTGTITAAQAAGVATSLTCVIAGYSVNVGEFVNVAGNDQPTYATAKTFSTDTTAVTLNEALKYATGAAAVATVYKACTVQANAVSGYSETVMLNGWTVAPKVGQLIAFNAGTRHTYTIIESFLVSTGVQGVILDRPLDFAITAADLAFPGPAGTFNWAFHRDAVALVTRPLALPNTAMGVMADVAVHNSVSMRVTMQYDIQSGGTVVNLDILAGLALLDANLCVPLLG